jgi:hypothetical protein
MTARARIFDDLRPVIQLSLPRFRPDECARRFRYCGYGRPYTLMKNGLRVQVVTSAAVG